MREPLRWKRVASLSVGWLAVIVFAAPSQAEEDITREGFYVGAGGGLAVRAHPGGGDTVRGAAYGRAGYDFGDEWAELSWLGAELRLDWRDLLQSSDVAMTGNVRLFAPQFSNGRVYAVGGVGSSFEGSAEATVRGGIGVDAYMTEQIVFNLEAVYNYVDESSGRGYVSAVFGLLYKF